MWSVPQCVRAATTNTKHSTVTTRRWGGAGGGGGGRIQEITHSRSAPIAPSSWNPYET